MIELHGWITIRESYIIDNESNNIDRIVIEIKKYINDLQCLSNLIKLEYHNGVPCITISLFTNHFSQDVREVFELMNFIGAVAIGSYGMIYLHDDENKDGKDNEFQVHTLAKGIVVENRDNLLSPLIPKIEDAEV